MKCYENLCDTKRCIKNFEIDFLVSCLYPLICKKAKKAFAWHFF